MKLKDKIKSVAIGMVTTVMTSCGFKSNEAQVIERNSDEHAFADAPERYIDEEEVLTSLSLSDAGLVLDDSIDIKNRQKWQEKLDEAGIPSAKKGENDTDSLLVSIEEKDDKLQNPIYGFNPSTDVQVTEQVGDYYIKRNGKKQKE